MRRGLYIVASIALSGCAAEGDEPPPYAPRDAGPPGSLDAAPARDAGAVPADAPRPPYDIPWIDAGGCMGLAGVDPAGLPSCCTMGGARCIPGSLIPPGLASLLESCMGAGRCVPDAVVRAGSAYAPRACMSVGGEGRCLSLCIPMVAANRALLPRADCAADERCAPCVNPLTGRSSGACDALSTGCGDAGATPGDGGATAGDGGGTPGDGGAVCPHVGPPLIDPTTFPACCPEGGARCVPAALVTPAQAATLARCAGGYCAPEAFIAAAGRYVPPRCASVGGAEGRCLSVCLPAVAAQAALLPPSTCAAGQRCAPCYDPFTGAPTGACTQSCDPGPTDPPVRFADCCSGRGRCIPESAVPMSQRDRLAPRDCRAGSLCVPTENLDLAFRGPRCGAVNRLTGRAYEGVCVSDCTRLGFFGFLTLERGNCTVHHVCAPCVHPLTGRPTGAPGCS